MKLDEIIGLPERPKRLSLSTDQTMEMIVDVIKEKFDVKVHNYGGEVVSVSVYVKRDRSILENKMIASIFFNHSKLVLQSEVMMYGEADYVHPDNVHVPLSQPLERIKKRVVDFVDAAEKQQDENYKKKQLRNPALYP